MAEVSLVKLPSDEGQWTLLMIIQHWFRWCLTAPSHYLSQCWPRSVSPYDVTGPHWVNISVHIFLCVSVTPQLVTSSWRYKTFHSRLPGISGSTRQRFSSWLLYCSYLHISRWGGWRNSNKHASLWGTWSLKAVTYACNFWHKLSEAKEVKFAYLILGNMTR